VLAEASIGGGWSLSPDAPATMVPAGQVLEGEADGLLSLHGQLTRSDLTAPDEIASLIGAFETEMSQVTARWELTEARLRTLQSQLVGMYKRGEVSVDDWFR
jgi:hypothetical protein